MLFKFFLFKDSLGGAVLFFGVTLLLKVSVFTSYSSLPYFFILLSLTPFFPLAFGFLSAEKRQKRFIEKTLPVVEKMIAASEFLKEISFDDWRKNGVDCIRRVGLRRNIIQRVLDLTLKQLSEDFHEFVRGQERLRVEILEIKKRPENYRDKKTMFYIDALYSELERSSKLVEEKKKVRNEFLNQVERLGFRVWPDYAMYVALEPLK